jgi:hypothetical protein
VVRKKYMMIPLDKIAVVPNAPTKSTNTCTSTQILQVLYYDLRRCDESVIEWQKF